MGIIVEGQTIVTNILCSVDGLGHRADGNHGEHILLWTVVNLGHQVIDALTDGLVVARGWHLVTKSGCQCGEVLQLLR